MMGEGAASGLRSSAAVVATATAGALGVAGAGLDSTTGAAVLAIGAVGATAGAVATGVADATAGLASLAASSACSGSSCAAAVAVAGCVAKALGVPGICAMAGATAGVGATTATAAADWARPMLLSVLPVPFACRAIKSSCRAVLATTGCCGDVGGMAGGAAVSTGAARAASNALACCCCRSFCAAASRRARACSIFSCRSSFSACCAWAIKRANCCFWVLLNWRPLPLPLACRAAICLCKSLDEGIFSSFLPRALLCAATVLLAAKALLARACLLLRPAGAASACALPLVDVLVPFLLVGVALADFLSAVLPLRLADAELPFAA